MQDSLSYADQSNSDVIDDSNVISTPILDSTTNTANNFGKGGWNIATINNQTSYTICKINGGTLVTKGCCISEGVSNPSGCTSHAKAKHVRNSKPVLIS